MPPSFHFSILLPLSMPLCTNPPSKPNPESAADNAWVAAAMADDTMVVELLAALREDALRFHRPGVLPLEWSVRQRRSKPVSLPNQKKPGHQGSPTTPLSWSGATSFSGGSGGGGSEESALRSPANKLFNKTGSKVGEIRKATFKRSRKKKNLAELKEEENTLIKERRELNREIAALRVHVEKQRARNENLKRIKLESQPLNEELATCSEETISDELEQTTTACCPLPPPTMPSNASSRSCRALQSSSTNGSSEENSYAASDSKLILPDLNIPLDEVQTSNVVVCGVS